MNNKPKIYFENLDSLRFLAFFAVFVSHAALFLGFMSESSVYQWIKYNILVNGDLGVTFFFVLSGFLITFLLLKEREVSGSISLKNFYLRRILRIWPVYFIVLFMGYLLIPHLFSLFGSPSLPMDTVPPPSAWPWHTFFVTNFAMSRSLFASVPTDILWSVGIEEQFYLLWPVVVILIPKRMLAKIVGLIVFAAFIFRGYFAYEPDVLAYSTFSAMSDLGIGCLLAIFVFNRDVQRLKVLFSKGSTWLLYALILILTISRHWLVNYFSEHGYILNMFVPVLYLFISISFALVIFEQNESDNSIFKAGKLPLMSSLGRISYGLYAYHPAVYVFVLLIMTKVGISTNYSSVFMFVVVSASALIGTIYFSKISYVLVEKWFLKKKPSSLTYSDNFSL